MARTSSALAVVKRGYVSYSSACPNNTSNAASNTASQAKDHTEPKGKERAATPAMCVIPCPPEMRIAMAAQKRSGPTNGNDREQPGRKAPRKDPGVSRPNEPTPAAQGEPSTQARETPSTYTAQRSEPEIIFDGAAETDDEMGNVPTGPDSQGASRAGNEIKREEIKPKEVELSGPIRAVAGSERLSMIKLLSDVEVVVKLNQLLDKSVDLRKELAWMLQSAAPRYRRKPVTRQSAGQASAKEKGKRAVHMAAFDPLVVSEALDDDGNSMPMYAVSWVQGYKVPATLLDSGSLVELIAEWLLKAFGKRGIEFNIHTDEGKEISLADNTRTRLTRYIHVPVNIAGVVAEVKCYIIPATTYGILLGLRWMRRVRFFCDFGTGVVTCRGRDGEPQPVECQLAPMECLEELPTVEDLDEDLQKIIDEDPNEDLEN
ncbi:hypothetical protein ETB97_008863 [Aspergillus alliaceus]|uniref:Uncharacterized protein n=1 Tax=Petromyces alliaceus TaxID=209559 RepID=A0A8H5ZXD1_PETAA|nr:hypothetical protein ETB97_008863 [Aspergillus burnettii]